MAITTYTFPDWNSTYAYSRWDLFYSVGFQQYFYATADHTGSNPIGQWTYTCTNVTRSNNVTRATFTATGGEATFRQGSMVVIAGVTAQNGTWNYTGTCLAGGNGYVDYLNPGLDVSSSVAAGQVVAPIHPNWTTGFYWVPTFSTDITHEQAVIRTPLGDGYSQRFNPVINSNSLSWNLQFDERTDKETVAMLVFLQSFGGANPFVINLPIGTLYNKPGLKYISGPARHGLTSYGLDSVNVPVTQVFDI